MNADLIAALLFIASWVGGGYIAWRLCFGTACDRFDVLMCRVFMLCGPLAFLIEWLDKE